MLPVAVTEAPRLLSRSPESTAPLTRLSHTTSGAGAAPTRCPDLLSGVVAAALDLLTKELPLRELLSKLPLRELPSKLLPRELPVKELPFKATPIRETPGVTKEATTKDLLTSQATTTSRVKFLDRYSLKVEEVEGN